MSEYQQEHAANQERLITNWIAPIGVGLAIAIIVGMVAANNRDVKDHLMIEKIQTSISEIKETVKSNHLILTDLQKNDVLQDHRIKVLEEKVP